MIIIWLLHKIIKNVLYNNQETFDILTEKTRNQEITYTEISIINTPGKWVNFTCISRQWFFKDTNLKILFKTKNTVGNLLKHNRNNINSHKESHIHQFMCPNCGKRYVGQSDISSYGLKNIFSHLNCIMINASSFSTLLQTDIHWAQLIKLLMCFI